MSRRHGNRRGDKIITEPLLESVERAGQEVNAQRRGRHRNRRSICERSPLGLI